MISRHAEVRRVARHIADAERQLDARDVSALSPSVRRVRAFAIASLREYRRAGRFPQNPSFAAATPFFIDAHGTRCAMAHLLELVGAGDLVARVARTANNARVHELAGDPEFLAWLMVLGFTVEEAARVQPAYEVCAAPTSCFCDSEPSEAIAFATVIIGRPDGGIFVTARIDVVHKGTMSVGDRVQVATAAAVGDSLLIARRDHVTGPFSSLPHQNYGALPCGPSCTSLPRETIVEALLSTDCHAALVAADPSLAAVECYTLDGGVERDASRCGGDTSGGDTGLQVEEPTSEAGESAGCGVAAMTASIAPAAALLTAAFAVALRRRYR